MTTTDMSGLNEFKDDSPLPDEITSGDDLIQSAPRTMEGDREYDYKLTAFIPSASTPASGQGIPSEAAYWIIPDINNCVILTAVKIFELSWMKKVPASFNTLYLRVDSSNNINPTEWQDAIWKSVVSNYQRQDGRAQASQMYLVPVIRRYKGEWEAAVGEMGVTAFNEIKKANAAADDFSDGRINLSTRPVGIWKPAKKEVTARFDKGADVDVQDMIKKYADDMPDVRKYVKLRATKTETYLRDQWRKVQGERTVEDVDDSGLDAKGRFIDATLTLKLAQLQTLLSENKIDPGGAKTKMALIDVVLANRDQLEAAVLAAAAVD